MSAPRVLILRAPGTNCDLETAHGFELARASVDRIHVNRLLEKPSLVDEYQIFCIPGGFSYGDDIAAGRILANQIRLHLADTLLRCHDQGKLILGICNGFQALLRCGILLPGPKQWSAGATLSRNDSGRFEDRWVNLSVTSQRCVFLAGLQSLYLPVAHAEGKFVVHDASTIESLDAAGQLVLRYVTPLAAKPFVPAPYPFNPNGSMDAVAGVCDPTGRILGLMPHPERYVDRTQHPRWTRENTADPGDGLKVFDNAVRYFTDS